MFCISLDYFSIHLVTLSGIGMTGAPQPMHQGAAPHMWLARPNKKQVEMPNMTKMARVD